MMFNLFSHNFYGQTTLQKGDVLIVGYNSFNEYDFAFVFLVDVVADTEIYFTDLVRSDNTFRPEEGVEELFTASRAYTTFEIVVYNSSSTEWTYPGDEFVGDKDFNLSVAGDQILAFQGTTETPNFITAIQFSDGFWDATANNHTTSALPQGLTTGIDCYAVGKNKSAMYNGTPVGDVKYPKSTNSRYHK